MRLIQCIISMILVASSLKAADVAFPSAGSYKADMLVAGMSQEADAIGKKLQQALAADPAWIQAYLKETAPKPGEPLPYHPKMGITQKEYAALQAAGKSMSLQKVADAVVTIGEDQGKISLRIESGGAPSQTFEFSPDGQAMKCLLGTSGAPKAINNRDESSPTGAWTGSQWTITEGTPDMAGTADAYQFSVAIGKDLKKRHLIYVRALGRRNQRREDIAFVKRCQAFSTNQAGWVVDFQRHLPCYPG